MHADYIYVQLQAIVIFKSYGFILPTNTPDNYGGEGEVVKVRSKPNGGKKWIGWKSEKGFDTTSFVNQKISI